MTPTEPIKSIGGSMSKSDHDKAIKAHKHRMDNRKSKLERLKIFYEAI